MLVAALDSTAITASAAVAEIGANGLETYSVFTCKNKMTHSETLLPMLESALLQYGASAKDIDLFCVSAGPGSFTGVRIGVATVKGLAFAEGKPCVGVSTLEALAGNIGSGIVMPLMDAKRNQFYVALFENGRRIWNDEALSAEEIAERIKCRDKITVCGDGAKIFANAYTGSNIELAPPAALEQNALSVALTGHGYYISGVYGSAASLKPIYLRKPQAEREREEKETALKN